MNENRPRMGHEFTNGRRAIRAFVAGFIRGWSLARLRAG